MKRSSLVMCIVAALALTTSTWTAVASETTGHADAAAKPAKPDKYDADQDGKLSDQEKAAKKAAKEAEHKAKLLAKYDANKNGTLDPDEEAKCKADEDAAKAKRAEKAAAKAAEKAAAGGDAAAAKN